MTSNELALWNRIDAFAIDAPEASFPFSARLAREQGWSDDFTRRVIAEYKRFCFLAVTAGHPISPSEIVDEAWHLHMIYTENYWKEFCPHALGKPFHHWPTEGGPQERAKFDDWYARTLESYEKFFGEKPPRDIWTPAGTPSLPKGRIVHVDTASHWDFKKPRLRWNPMLWVATLALGAVGCTQLAAQANPFDFRGPEFLMFYIVCTCVGLCAAYVVRTSNIKPEEGAAPGPLTPFEVAYLNEGPVLAVNAAIAGLLANGAIRMGSRAGTLSRANPAIGVSDPVEPQVLKSIQVDTTVSHVRYALESELNRTEAKLRSLGLYVSEENLPKTTTLPFLVALIAPLIGIIKIMVGVEREKPVLFLVILSIVSILVALPFLKKPGRTPYGTRVLLNLQFDGKAYRKPTMDAAFMSIALFGAMGLGDPIFGNDARKHLTPSSGSSSCGGGCGSSSGDGGGDGGGCGGGCGGCGG